MKPKLDKFDGTNWLEYPMFISTFMALCGDKYICEKEKMVYLLQHLVKGSIAWDIATSVQGYIITNDTFRKAKASLDEVYGGVDATVYMLMNELMSLPRMKKPTLKDWVKLQTLTRRIYEIQKERDPASVTKSDCFAFLELKEILPREIGFDYEMRLNEEGGIRCLETLFDFISKKTKVSINCSDPFKMRKRNREPDSDSSDETELEDESSDGAKSSVVLIEDEKSYLKKNPIATKSGK